MIKESGSKHRKVDIVAGYNGKKMSNNAIDAYVYGEKPISKWTKKAIMETVEEYELNNNVKFSHIRKLTLPELRSTLLIHSSWHHTSALYNQTDFYMFNEAAFICLTPERVEEIIAKRERKTADSKSCDKDTLESAKDLYEKIMIILESGVTGLKTSSGVLKRISNGKTNVDELYSVALDTLAKNEKSRIEAWKRLPADHYRWNDVKKFESNRDIYFREKLVSEYSANCKLIKELKNYILVK